MKTINCTNIKLIQLTLYALVNFRVCVYSLQIYSVPYVDKTY